jgi:light-regulated signal transduction histidine kinase (bacteriophytochrome)
VIAQVRDELQTSSAGRQIVWQIAPLPPVMADAALLRVVWTNLIANAIKFTGPRTPAVIEIGAIPPRPDDGKVTFCIKDNGVGFDPTQASRLFGVFQRLHSDDEFEGSGIGLALVRRIIQRHDGEIWAEAVPDAGAIFYFTLKPAMIHGSEAHQDVASGVP